MQYEYYDDDARQRVLGGAKKLYDAVRVTMGPKGRNVVIKDNNGYPTVTHDGVTVAKRIRVKDTPETRGYSVGADLIRQAANQNNDKVGDGTTTTTVLAYHILAEANKLIAAGHNPMDMRKELDAAASDVLDALPAITTRISDDPAKLTQVATISSGDDKMGELVASVVGQVGAEGGVTVDLNPVNAIEAKLVEGYKWSYGYVSPYMVTDAGRLKAIFKDAYILVTSDKITDFIQIKAAAESVLKAGKKELVIIGDEIANEALAAIVLNKVKGMFHVLFVKAPGFGDVRKQMLEDIAILTGATLVGEDFGAALDSVTLDDLGRARSVEADKDSTVIVEGGGDKEQVANRVDQIRAAAREAVNDADKFNLPNRASALEGKVALIRVGGATEAEIEEKKYRIDDAVAATKAALAEGIVPGGGVALLDLVGLALSHNTSLGASILEKALKQPFRQLMENAGLNPDEKLPEVMKAAPGQGFNVNSADELIDLVESGIIDPAKVTREAITNAVSIAGTAMTMGCLVTDDEEDPKND